MKEEEAVDYQRLYKSYISSIMICDPIEFANRQKCLLEIVARYLLVRDNPEAEKTDDS